MNVQTEDVDYAQMKATVGSLFFLWASVEASLEANIGRLRSVDGAHAPCGIKRSVLAWHELACESHRHSPLQHGLCNDLKEMLLHALEIRNSIAHGFRGAVAGPPTAACLVVRFKGKVHQFRWMELQLMFSGLSRVPRAIDALSTRLPDQGIAQSLPPDEWFPTWEPIPLPSSWR